MHRTAPHLQQGLGLPKLLPHLGELPSPRRALLSRLGRLPLRLLLQLLQPLPPRPQHAVVRPALVLVLRRLILRPPAFRARFMAGAAL